MVTLPTSPKVTYFSVNKMIKEEQPVSLFGESHSRNRRSKGGQQYLNLTT